MKTNQRKLTPFVIGIGGSPVSRMEEVASELSKTLGEDSGSSLNYKNFPTRVSEKEVFPIVQWKETDFNSGAFFARLEKEKANAVSYKIVVLGPLVGRPEIRNLCDATILLDLGDQLALLRWAEALMSLGAPGGVEALEFYFSHIAEPEEAWYKKNRGDVKLVLEDEGPVAYLASKIHYLVQEAGLEPTPTISKASTEKVVKPASIEELKHLEDHLQKRVIKPSPVPLLWARLRRFYHDSLYPMLKRGIDFFLIGIVLLFAWPIYFFVAFLVWSSDPGPVFYVQKRVGRFGKIISFPKFRTMVQNADQLKDKLLAQNEMTGGVTFKMKRDPRVLPIGRVLRKFSLDEIPQLWSVLRGELTIVGPRPPVPREVVLYTSGDRRRLEIQPGLTCIWQVSGRSEIPFPQQVELDVEYMERRSLLLDIRLMVATIPAVVFGKGAY